MAARNEFSFDDFAKLCPSDEIERFRENYGVMFDTNGVVFSHTVGFHFSGFDDDDPADETRFIEMAKLFKPVAIWAGSAELHAKLTEMRYTVQRYPYFEEGGFMVVLKIPVARQPKS
jgi:hypothetical protein